MKHLPAVLIFFVAACAPAPTRPPQPTKAEVQARALLVQEREARLRAEREREEAERALAELRRKEAEERQPQAGKVELPPTIAAQPLEPQAEAEPSPQVAQPPAQVPQPPAEAAAAAPAEKPVIAAVKPRAQFNAFSALQLSEDLRKLRAETDMQSLYNERGWVLSLGAESLFEPGAAQLKPDAGQTLDRLADVLRHYAARGIVLDGPNTDRAQALKGALTARGIPDEGIAANGTGERIDFLVPHAHALSSGAGR
jgi:outer membrane protein OmpA-like peptidoglycan-associated protein